MPAPGVGRDRRCGASQSQSWRDGVIAGRYRIEHPLGEGGMGRVYAARQIGLERPVAIKILRPELARDPAALHRFQREARLVAQLASPHVVRVHDLGTLDSGEPYLVMELLDGEDLATVLARGPVAVDQAVAWIGAACEALGEAHALGIVHRDVKPSNLIATRQGRLVVVDFGLAKLAAPAGASAAVTADGLILGSPHYMAPEQVRGARDVDARADIWSLGATLYHLVTGGPPFPEATLQDVFGSILSGRPPPLDGIPPVIAGAIRRAMANEPAARFASTHELAAALRVQVPERYELLELLGEGSHGAVYRARQQPAVAIEWTGALPRSYVFDGDAWRIVPQMIHLPETGTFLFSTGACVAMILAPSAFIARLRNDLTDAQVRLAVQAWHFQRLGAQLIGKRDS